MHKPTHVTKSSTDISNLATDSIKVYQRQGIKSANYYCVIDSQAIQGWANYQGNEHLAACWINAAEVNLSKAECYLNGYGVTANLNQAKACFIEGVVQSFEYYKQIKTTSTTAMEENEKLLSPQQHKHAAMPHTSGMEANKL